MSVEGFGDAGDGAVLVEVALDLDGTGDPAVVIGALAALHAAGAPLRVAFVVADELLTAATAEAVRTTCVGVRASRAFPDSLLMVREEAAQLLPAARVVAGRDADGDAAAVLEVHDAVRSGSSHPATAAPPRSPRPPRGLTDVLDALPDLHAAAHPVEMRAAARAARHRAALAQTARDLQRSARPASRVRIGVLLQHVVYWGAVQTVCEALALDERVELHVVAMESFVHSAGASSRLLGAAGHVVRGPEWLTAHVGDLDVLLVDSPYDEFRPPALRAEELAATGTRLVYVPYGSTIGGGPVASRYAYDMPLQQVAWRTYLRSAAQVRALDEHCATGAGHARVLGVPKVDRALRRRAGAAGERWLARAAGRKVVLWNPHYTIAHGADHTWSTFDLYLEEMVRHFEGRHDAVLLVRPHFKLWVALKEAGARGAAWERCLRQAAERGALLLDDEPDYEDAFAVTDVMVSDASSLVSEFMPTGRPVVYTPRAGGAGLNEDASTYFADLYRADSWPDVARLVDMLVAGRDPGLSRRLESIDLNFPLADGRAGARVARDVVESLLRESALGAGPAAGASDDVAPRAAARVPAQQAAPREADRVPAQAAPPTRAAGAAAERAARHTPVEQLVLLGLAPARDSRGALLSQRIHDSPSHVVLSCSDGVEGQLDALLAPAAGAVAAVLATAPPAGPSWPEVTAHLADVLPRIDAEEAAQGQPYRELRSISASPLEHLTAACAKIVRPSARWTAEMVVSPSSASVPGREALVEADAAFQLLASGLLEAGYRLDELPERLVDLVEVAVLGLADTVLFETSAQAADVIGRCPVPEVAARARAVVRVSQEPAEIVKLVVWDLDDTFWEGTLAEDGRVRIPEENIRALKELTGRGIVSSICSKNDHGAALAVLSEHGLADHFVFPRIAFVPKGRAVEQLVADMGLRAVNVLFIDDNPSNLAEVAHYNPGIRTLDARDLPGLLLLPGMEGKPDPEHTRLGHYRLLEQRRGAQAAASSNEEFLRSSGLRVQLRPSRTQDADRVHEMITRTNQLNFTKRRATREEVDALLADPAAQSATVRVQDDFGDYGVVGWYCLRGGVLEHFLFSCRTMNLGIEQHVYAHLGHPPLTVVGETAAELSADDQLRDYIALEEVDEVEELASAGQASGTPSALLPVEAQLSVFVLSACDLFQAVGRLALPMVDVTFECNTFRGRQRGVNTGTEYVRSCVEMGPEDKAFCRENFLNYQGSTAFKTQIFDRPYDYVLLGIHDDLTFGQYRHKRRRDLVVQLDLELRDQLRRVGAGAHWVPLVDGHDAGEQQPGATWVRDEFDDEGLITPERLAENLGWILERLHPGTQLLLATAPEMPYYRSAAPDFPLLRERAVALNRAVREFCAAQPRAHVVEVNDVVFARDHVTDYVMHLTPERGHALAQLVLAQVAAHPSGVVDRRALLGLGARSVALWDTNPRRAHAVERVMTGAGIAPAVVVGDGGDVADRAAFVVAVCDEEDEPAAIELLGRTARVAGADIRTVRPWVFSPDWQEPSA